MALSLAGRSNILGYFRFKLREVRLYGREPEHTSIDVIICVYLSCVSSVLLNVLRKILIDCVKVKSSLIAEGYSIVEKLSGAAGIKNNLIAFLSLLDEPVYKIYICSTYFREFRFKCKSAVEVYGV